VTDLGIAEIREGQTVRASHAPLSPNEFSPTDNQRVAS
jgi:hypothetical protein